MRRSITLLAALVLTGCVRDQLVDCGDGRSCPIGTLCARLASGGQDLCVLPEQVTACDNVDDHEPCVLGATGGACTDGVCLPVGCGNGRVDPQEVCDDGNLVPGDGCSATCASDETCGNGVVDLIAGEQCDDNDRAHDGCAGCRLETSRWGRLELRMPDPRSASAITFDTARGRAVMFGGQYRAQGGLIYVTRDDTWESDGTGWVKIPTTITPPARARHVLAYDAGRRRVVMFGGGTSSSGVFRDTWEWDGTTWELVNAAPPPDRFDAAAVYDPRRKRVVMYGGQRVASDGVPLTDTWEWDGATWTERVLPTHPGPREGHSMIFDPRRGAIVLIGGSNNETWELDATGWSRADATSATGLTGARLGVDRTGVLAFGGLDVGLTTSVTRRWNGTSWITQTPSTIPPSRTNTVMASDPVRGRVLMFGGYRYDGCVMCDPTLGDAWTWDGADWSAMAVPGPAPRMFHATTHDPSRQRTILFGGSSSFAAPTTLNDTWLLDAGHWSRVVSVGPTARWRAALAFDTRGDRAILFGGQPTASGAALADTWALVADQWIQLTPTQSPPARFEHAMAYDRARDRIVMFGGSQGMATLGDTWEFDGTTWLQMPVGVAPAPRARHAMEYDPVRQRVTLFGGEVSGLSYADQWEWDGVAWMDVSTLIGPSPRGSTGLAWNAARGALTLFAGASQIFSGYDDTWERAVTTWVQQFVAAGPGRRQGHTLSSLADGTGVMLLAGADPNGAASADVWRLRWEHGGPYELCTIAEDTDGDGLAGCADPDCWAVCAPLCPPGAPCDPASPRCGDNVCNAALETCRMCPGDCGACGPACGDHVCDPGETAASCPGDCS